MGSKVNRKIMRGKRDKKKLKAIEFDLVTMSPSSFMASLYTKLITLYIDTPEKPGREDLLLKLMICSIIGNLDKFKSYFG